MSSNTDSTKLSQAMAQEQLWEWLLSEDLSDEEASDIVRESNHAQEDAA